MHGQLGIRRLDDDTLRRLKAQAAAHGVSMEEEVRRILRASVAQNEGLGDLMVRIFSRSYGDEPFELPPREYVEPMKFD